MLNAPSASVSGYASAVITGSGMAVPPRVVTNDDLAKLMNTSDEWIYQRSGIKQRRFVEEGQGPSDLAVEACHAAMTMAGVKPKDVDLLVIASLSPEHYFPGTGAFVQRKLGLGTTPAFDVRSQCSGFLYALNIARSFILAGQYQRILVCGVEVHSRALDFTDRGRDVSVLFGDGAAAFVVEGSQRPEVGIMPAILHTQGEHAERLWVEAPRLSASPHISQAMIDEGLASPKMDGKFVFKQAVERLPQVVNEVLAQHGLSTQDIDHYFFHQANLRINEFVCQAMGIPPTKTHNNIERYGNCSAASIPMCIDEAWRGGAIKPGNLSCLAAFGSGFSWGSLLIRW